MDHVEIHAHYLRQFYHKSVVSLEYCRIDDQVDDIFTKPLSKFIFIKLDMILGIHEASNIGGGGSY